MVTRITLYNSEEKDIISIWLLYQKITISINFQNYWNNSVMLFTDRSFKKALMMINQKHISTLVLNVTWHSEFKVNYSVKIWRYKNFSAKSFILTLQGLGFLRLNRSVRKGGVGAYPIYLHKIHNLVGKRWKNFYNVKLFLIPSTILKFLLQDYFGNNLSIFGKMTP